MARFEVELELTGLKVRIKGDREHVPSITNNLGRQVAGFFQPAAEIANQTQSQPTNFIEAEIVNSSRPTKRRGKRVKKNQTAGGPNGNLTLQAELALDFKHDPNTWGMPQQLWNTADKSIWLLYVVKKACGVAEMSSGVISHTFNKHFRQSGVVQTGNVTRDLGRRKAESPSLVGQDTTKVDEPWYLSDEGVKFAEKLVIAGKGPTQEALI